MLTLFKPTLLHSVILCACSGAGLSWALASSSISADWNWGRADEIHSVKVKSLLSHTQTHTGQSLRITAPLDWWWMTRNRRAQKMEKKEAWGRGKAREDAVFQSHLANGCHWCIQTPHHSPGHQILCCISTAANEINTGLLHACMCVCVCVCACVFCICM